MIKLNSITVNNFRNIRHAAISLHDVVVITGPENSGISDLFHVFPFLNFIINGTDEDLHAYFETGEAPGIGVIINTTAKEEGTVTFILHFSDSINKTQWIYKLVLSWTQGKRDFIQEENFGIIGMESGNPVNYLFNRNETRVKSCVELELYFRKFFPDSEQSIIRTLHNIKASFLNNSIGLSLQALGDLLHYKTYYFSGATLKNDMLKSMFGSVTLGEDLQAAMGILKMENINWEVFKEMLVRFLNIENVEVHEVESKNSTTDKTTCYSVFTFAGEEIFLNQLPDTSVNLIVLLTRIFLNQHHLFLIDEPEKYINPAHLQSILEYLANENYPLQFVISTNSVPLINAVLPQNIVLAIVNKDGMCDIENINHIMNKRQTGKGAAAFGSDSLFNID